eukprot:TRINITY_DN1993_c0_g1_i1.p1 TRINITY_DN1993_c0_g1~~TRINITY_DN1993_c0_g1_i1.p1  ORF type:complete len:469 (+),score=63.94 TRINITY_DN1993_c0_g1_i1:131-1408(+)
MFGDEGWTSVSKGATDSFAHRDCVLGGRLYRIINSGLQLQNAPEKPSLLMPRPEVRAQVLRHHPSSPFKVDTREVMSPGDAVIERHGRSHFPFHKLMGTLLGSYSHGMCAFYDPVDAIFVRHRIRRDFPEVGDCMYYWSPVESEEVEEAERCPYRAFFHSRQQAGDVHKFDVTAAFFGTDNNALGWAQLHTWLLLRLSRSMLQRLLSMPYIPEMWALDKEYYVVLQLHSFKRGPPLLPATDATAQENAVAVTAGKKGESSLWERYSAVAPGKFRLSEYLASFLRRLPGTPAAEVFDKIDGRQLVPYQCAMRRESWEAVEDRFTHYFLIQKTAYRRANGGRSAPAFQEAEETRFLPAECPDAVKEQLLQPCQKSQQPRVFVRNTFLDVDEEHNDESPKRGTRRLKTSPPENWPKMKTGISADKDAQ